MNRKTTRIDPFEVSFPPQCFLRTRAAELLCSIAFTERGVALLPDPDCGKNAALRQWAAEYDEWAAARDDAPLSPAQGALPARRDP